MKMSPRNLAAAAIAALGLAGVYLARHVLLPFLLAAVIAYALEPVVELLERRGVKRAWAALLVMMALLLALAGAVMAFVPEMIEQLRQFADRLPGYTQAVRERVAPATTWLQQRYPEQLEAIRKQAIEKASGVLPALAGWAAAGLQRVLTSAVNLVVWMLTIVVVPVFVYYLLVDRREVHATLESLIPAQARPAVQHRVDQIDKVLRAWLKGQLTVASVLAVIYAVGLSLLGVPLGLLIGVAGGLANMVPYLGLVVGYLPAVILSLLDTGGWTAPLMVTGVFVLGQVLESTVISPRVVGSGLGLPPALVLLSIFVGGELFGFTGLLLAVPATAAGLVLLRDLKSSFDASSHPREPDVITHRPVRRRRPRQ